MTKLIKDSGTDHWALNKVIACGRCTSEFQAEKTSDFHDYDSYIIIECPKCKKHNRAYRPTTKKDNQRCDESLWENFDKAFEDFNEVFENAPWSSTRHIVRRSRSTDNQKSNKS